ncbi:MAG: hypothetical protein PHF67_01415 [Candidatus Nanoarchaeia archaeon]|nr:hypothetical protein [Candidatus Nanoarchaeia archaeon]
MKKSLLKLIGTGLIGLTSLFNSGCCLMDGTTKQNPITARSSVSESIVSDTVANLGIRFGKGPCAHTYADVGLSNGKFDLTGFTWVNYSITDSKTVEQDYGLEGKFNINENFSFSSGLQYWQFTIGENPVGALALNYNKDRFNAELRTLSVLDDGGTIYIGNLKKTFPVEGTDFSFAPTLKLAYSDGFYGRQGMLYVTPGVSANFGKIGPIDVSGFARYQIGIETDNIWYGGINFEVKSGKVPLIGEKKEK